jgi:putative component of membrane protein insertase Oxa1/YidC/SpoIIIJ protein YidD
MRLRCQPLLLLLFLLVCSLPLQAVRAEDSYTVLVPASDNGRKGQRHALDLYQRHISKHDGARCRFYPTCSDFFREAADRYGVLWASIMTLERMLYREHGWNLRFYPPTSDGARYTDPVFRNYIFDAQEYYR